MKGHHEKLALFGEGFKPVDQEWPSCRPGDTDAVEIGLERSIDMRDGGQIGRILGGERVALCPLEGGGFDMLAHHEGNNSVWLWHDRLSLKKSGSVQNRLVKGSWAMSVADQASPVKHVESRPTARFVVARGARGRYGRAHPSGAF
jgi:hypothetical protein